MTPGAATITAVAIAVSALLRNPEIVPGAVIALPSTLSATAQLLTPDIISVPPDPAPISITVFEQGRLTEYEGAALGAHESRTLEALEATTLEAFEVTTLD